MKSALRFLAVIAGIAGLATAGSAGTITLQILGSDGRTASLTDAVSGVHGNSINYGASDLQTIFGGVWQNEGELAPGDGAPGGIYSNDLFTVNLTSGSWGGKNVAGTWAIDDDFWTLWGSAVITIHVGNGNGDPDAFAWLVTPGETSGTWSYVDHDDKGGGLSNIKLWGSDEPNRVPDRGTTVMLIGLGLAALAIAARRTKRS